MEMEKLTTLGKSIRLAEPPSLHRTVSLLKVALSFKVSEGPKERSYIIIIHTNQP